MASPVISVSVPKTMLTPPAMNGMTGGRPRTTRLTISERIVVAIRAQVPAAMPWMPLTTNIATSGPISPEILTVCSVSNG